MKLYTELDIKSIGQWATQWDLYELDKEINSKPPMFKEFVESLTPIVLPSDEEIEKYLNGKYFADKMFRIYFIEGAKWAIERILNQNK